MQLFLKIPRVASAFEWAVAMHREQEYGGLPYFTHLLAVMENISDPSEDELVAAALHDVVEDTEVTVEDVAERFGDHVAEIVRLLTKDENLSYEGNILRIVHSGNRSAVKVKWADNLANMTGDKSHMKPERRERLNTQYASSFATLSAVLGV